MRLVDCVVFDVGNVLVRWNPDKVFRNHGYSDAEMKAVLDETRLMEINHRALDAGGSFEAVMADLASRFPHHAPLLLAFHTRWEDTLDGQIDANVEVLGELKRAGVPVHIISNFNHEKFEQTCALFPFLNSCDERVVSGYEGIVKPEPEIFELLLERRGLEAHRAVFIDDMEANLATARQLGFHTVHFCEGKTDLRRELVKLGVLPERT